MENAGEQLVTRLKAMADPQRLRLLALCRHGECSVGELADVLGQSQPRISQQLKWLCDADLLERYRDGRRVYYRTRTRGDAGRRRLLALLPDDEPRFERDAERLRRLRADGADGAGDEGDSPERRALHRAILAHTVTAPVGDLLDVGCGRGRLLKLLASRANRAVGVDIDAGARSLARAELMLAGLPNCSLRQGDMYRLPFEGQSFDMVILDDVLGDAQRPVDALAEARRLLRPAGRLLVLMAVDAEVVDDAARRLAGWAAAAGLRLAQPRPIPSNTPAWLLTAALPADSGSAAA